jgi:HlyD family secretion protein
LRRAAFVVVLIAAAALVIGWLVWQQARTPPFIVSGFIEADLIQVGSRVGGRVAQIMVEEGQRVDAGDPLFAIEPFTLQDQLAEAKAALAASRAELERLRRGFRTEEIEQARAKRDQAAAALEQAVAGPREQEIEIAREQLAQAKADLELAESEYARLERLREQGQAATIEYDQSVRTLKASRARVAAAEQELALLQAGTRKEEIARLRAVLAEAEQSLALHEAGYRPEDIARAQADVAAGEARLAAIQKQVSELTVAAPCACLVEAFDLRPGDLVSANAPAVSLLDRSNLWVRTYVSEAHLPDVRLGQRVPIRITNRPGERYMGRVTFIATDAEFTPKNIQTPEERSKQVFRVKVTLTEGQDVLRVGMSADVLFNEALADD